MNVLTADLDLQVQPHQVFQYHGADHAADEDGVLKAVPRDIAAVYISAGLATEIARDEAVEDAAEAPKPVVQKPAGPKAAEPVKPKAPAKPEDDQHAA